MAWLYLVVAGILEIVWASFMKESQGFTRLMPTIVTFVAMAASFWLLAVAMRSLPLGTAYAIWTGIGAVGAFLVGIAIMGEPATLGRIVSALLLVSGMIGLKLTSGH
ncbi:multidrug efflux SMR transporter [Aquamicrobium sp. LC103]|uniref:DMT family transporter n=1 Tax=Aquamicrobium sp. LC103 TaxID=1120658 RepID=UPI00063EB9AD|nr:multidrug efflux SMR transporter [Aquamicrobium sp. LC103]TKT80345.1 multidrug efflux SMR transporter [Aquamicrobium sp. LC103]